MANQWKWTRSTGSALGPLWVRTGSALVREGMGVGERAYLIIFGSTGFHQHATQRSDALVDRVRLGKIDDVDALLGAAQHLALLPVDVALSVEIENRYPIIPSASTTSTIHVRSTSDPRPIQQR